MYIYAGSDGKIKEIVNDVYLRQANDNINHIYLYVEDLPVSYISLGMVRYKLPNGTITTEESFSLNKITKTIPYNKIRDLKFFKDYKEYEFYDITLPNEVLAEEGLVLATIRFVDDMSESIYALENIPFYIENSVVKKTEDINEDQYNYLIKLIGESAAQVVANPIAPASEVLNKLKVDDVIYSVEGGGGTGDYEELENLPKINGVTLIGNKSLSEFSIASISQLNGKVDKETGKGLSTNDFTNAYKNKVDTNESDITDIQGDLEDVENDVADLQDDVGTLQGNVSTLQSNVSGINAKIDNSASSSDKLIPESKIDEKISSVEARQLYRTNAQGSFETKAQLNSASVFYLADGSSTSPTLNDVAYVLADETHDGKLTKYTVAKISPLTWGYVISISETTFTQEQLNAINSGITSAKVSSYDGYATSKQNTLVSGTNIKTINNNSILGSGDITITGGVTSVNTKTGAVVLVAGDIKATNNQTIQANLERIDERIDDLPNDTDFIDLTTTSKKIVGAINELDSSKLDKITETTSYQQVYVKSENGSQVMKDITPSVINSSVMSRDSSGRSRVSTPTETTHIANKSYVDDADALKLNISDVLDSLGSTATNKALSANKGKELNDRVASLEGVGRYLSNWNAQTGLPTTNPTTELPYSYKSGDYYIVTNVGTTNYKPTGSSYTGDASTTVETQTVRNGDTYRYDGSSWTLTSSGGQEVAFANLSGQPTDNTALATALNGKADADDLDDKVDKITTASKVYATNSSGSQTSVAYSQSLTNSAIVQRNSSGQILVGEPTLDSHSATKYYVDNGLNNKVSKSDSHNVLYGTSNTGTQTTYNIDDLLPTVTRL